MRLLVLGDSRLLAWTAGRLSPPGTEIVGVASLDDAMRALVETPPDAAIVNLPSSRVAWRDFQRLCVSRVPPVPVLYVSTALTSAEEAGLESAAGYAALLRAPARPGEMESAIETLFAAAREARASG